VTSGDDGQDSWEATLAKRKIYTVPLTLRITPAMQEFVEQQALEKGLAPVDWIRFAIAFAYWEENFVKNYERFHAAPGYEISDDFDHPKELELVCDEWEDPNSHTRLEHQARMAMLRARKS
jgi:hypothetical protein